MKEIHLSQDDLAPTMNRLKRARGQLDGILRMIDEDRDCADVLTQLAAASKAIDRAGFALIAAGLLRCQVEGESSRQARDRLEKMFLALA
jgi:DNA-binding FrmR family transcriptional regulator